MIYKIFTSNLFSKALLFFFCFFTTECYSQVFQTRTFDDKIQTLKIYKKGWVYSTPNIQLLTDEQIQLEFDCLSDNSNSYQYKIVHCDPWWKISDINESDYLNGFSIGNITSYEQSFNTTVPYFHYTLNLPNDEMQLKISGNYVIQIFEMENPNKIILTALFSVSENSVTIKTAIKMPLNGMTKQSKQEVDFKILYPNITIKNPLEEIKVVVKQNQRNDNMISNLKPLYIRPDELIYDYTEEVQFDAGNEFRWLDLRSLRIANDRIKNISYNAPYYHFQLFPDISKANASYYYYEDFNGQYTTDAENVSDPTYEADYVYVHFSIPLETPFVDVDPYVAGEFMHNTFTEKNRFSYNWQTHAYELQMLLKQGYYSYTITLRDKANKRSDATRFEGNFTQTENDYQIYVYQKKQGEYYYRMIGFTNANSLLNANNVNF